MVTTDTEPTISSEVNAGTPQARVLADLDRASELQYHGKLAEAVCQLEAALAIAHATPYEIEFMTRIRLGMALADLYLALGRLEDARTLAVNEAAFTYVRADGSNPGLTRTLSDGASWTATWQYDR